MGRRPRQQSALGTRQSSHSQMKGHPRWLLLVLILHAKVDFAQGRSWKDVLSEEDIDQSLRGSSNGKHNNRHRPGEHWYESEENPFDVASSPRDIISYNEEMLGDDAKESTFDIPTPTPTTKNIRADPEIPTSRVSSYSDTTSSEPRPDNLFQRRPLSSSTARTRDITSYRTTRTFVPPTESPRSSISIFSDEPDPISENPSTPSPTEEADRYAYPENSVMPSKNLPWGYFNYDMSQESWHGPGYPFFTSGNDGLVIEYANNAWMDYQPPPPIPPREAMAIANGITSDEGYTDYFYWDEFGPNALGFGPWKNTLDNIREAPNQCGEIGRQSPIDIRPNGFACLEHHQIRTRRGDFRVFGSRNNLDLEILPSKLRVGVRRRPCRQIENPVCSEPDPPHADFPHGWPGFVDVLHVDFKFPSEHKIYGKSFDGEMQIYHLHPGRKRLPVVSVLMEVVEDENDRDAGHNEYLQEVIDGFQYEYDANRAKCAHSVIQNRNRRLQTDHAEKQTRCRDFTNKTLQSTGDGSIDAKNANFRGCPSNGEEENGFEDDKTIEDLANKIFGTDPVDLESHARLLDENSTFSIQKESYRRRLAGIWNPHHEALVPSIYFYGYDGSLTEPPCSEIVSWFIVDETMKISRNQLEQMKFLLFTNVDGSTCETTSAHYQGSVARPIQETGSNRQIWHCTSDDYLPD